MKKIYIFIFALILLFIGIFFVKSNNSNNSTNLNTQENTITNSSKTSINDLSNSYNTLELNRKYKFYTRS